MLEEVTNHIQKVAPNESCYITFIKVHVEANSTINYVNSIHTNDHKWQCLNNLCHTVVDIIQLIFALSTNAKTYLSKQSIMIVA